jgi:hypothetical protein
LNFFTASLFQRGKEWKESSIECQKVLLPLKKGGWEGFLARPFQNVKVLQKFIKPDGLPRRPHLAGTGGRK